MLDRHPPAIQKINAFRYHVQSYGSVISRITVCRILQVTIVDGQNPGAVVRFDAACIDLLADKFRHAAVEVIREILHLAEHFLDADAFQQFLYPKPAFLLRSGVNMHFIDAAEQVMRIAENFLISADEKYAEIIGFAGAEIMQRQVIHRAG